MDTGTLTIKQIFGQDRRLVVPLFQRPYVWKRETQWEPLWNDVQMVAEHLLRHEPVRPHFLGAIVLDQIRKPLGYLASHLIIDGQQRLTTIQLLLEAFADICAEFGTEKYHKALLKLTRNDDPMSEAVEEQYKIWPTNIDQEHFCHVMDASSPLELLKAYDTKPSAHSVGNTIADCYLFYYDEIRNWIAPQTEGDESRIEALYNALREYLRMVVIDLDKEDDAQLIFETLNARGTPLLPSDLVKNFIFHKADIEGEKIEPLYDKYWKSFDAETKFWRQEIGPGHAKRARIDLYLQHYLALCTRDEVPSAQIYATFRETANKSPQVTAKQHLSNIRRYADIYQSFSQLDQDNQVGIFFYRLDIMGVTTLYPFLLALFEKYGTGNEEVKLVLTDLESYLVRRMICQLTTRAYNRTFLDLLTVFSDNQGSIAENVRNFLRELDSESNRWPRDIEFNQSWMERPIYNLLQRQRVRMVLEALERQMFTDFTEKLESKEILTIEHIMPQEWVKYWPLPQGVLPEESEVTRNRIIHTFGNLTLLTKALNPSVSNGAWGTKKDAIGIHSALTINRHIIQIGEWNEKEIEKRGRTLFALAQRIWPVPSA